MAVIEVSDTGPGLSERARAHLFEAFHGMNEPGPQRCDVCGASPLERVLHPVAVHYKGSGFYSTDYARGPRAAKDSGSSESSESST